MRFSHVLLLGATVFGSSGCYAAMLAGGAIRSNQRDAELVLGTGVTVPMIKAKQHLGISLNGINPATGQYVFAYGGGSTNANVYSDMLTKEFLKLGYESSAIQDTLHENLSSAQRSSLTARGLDLVLIGNLNLSTTSNYGAAMVGGEYASTGVTSLTIKGLDPASGKLMFIMSIQYGTAKNAGDVAGDISQLYRDVMSGTVKPSGVGAQSGVATSAAPGVKNSTPATPPDAPVQAPPVPVQPRPAPVAPAISQSAASATAAMKAPVLTSPGVVTGPGPTLTTLTPTLTWNSVDGATGYGVYIRDLTADAIMYSNDKVANVTSLVLADGLLKAGHSYRWNVRAKSAAGFGPFSAQFYFRE